MERISSCHKRGCQHQPAQGLLVLTLWVRGFGQGHLPFFAVPSSQTWFVYHSSSFRSRSESIPKSAMSSNKDPKTNTKDELAASGASGTADDDGSSKGSGKASGKRKAAADGSPNETNDAEKLMARREANRLHAFKSRQRSKFLLAYLQKTVNQLNADKAELERRNAVLTAQVEVLQQQNLALLQNQQQMLMQNQQQQMNSNNANINNRPPVQVPSQAQPAPALQQQPQQQQQQQQPPPQEPAKQQQPQPQQKPSQAPQDQQQQLQAQPQQVASQPPQQQQFFNSNPAAAVPTPQINPLMFLQMLTSQDPNALQMLQQLGPQQQQPLQFAPQQPQFPPAQQQFPPTQQQEQQPPPPQQPDNNSNNETPNCDV